MNTITIEELTPAHTRAARALKGWRGDELARLSGLCKSHIRHFESGRRVTDRVKQTLIDTIHSNGIELYAGDNYGARIAG